LLERVILSSSNEGDVVLDPFCGCGTAIAVAERFKRRWIGIDITHVAINIIRNRMAQSTFEVTGEPVNIEGATQLAVEDPYQFQWWILDRIGARPVDKKKKKGADSGIDGELFFAGAVPTAAPRRAIISVKAGKITPAHVRELRGVIEREGLEMGVLLTLHEPTQPMKAEAARAGFLESQSGRHPRIQILTAAQILDGKGVDAPGVTMAGLKKTRRAPPREEQMTIPGVASTRPTAKRPSTRPAKKG
ncbi:MAG TPA: DNA methyltransferase, partial [Polyangiaceae bacterium]